MSLLDYAKERLASMNVPHSGNECSAMCAQPCDHAGCWQCIELKLAEGKKREMREAEKALKAMRKEAAVYDAKLAAAQKAAFKIPAATPGRPPRATMFPRGPMRQFGSKIEGDEVAVISRQVLEGLVDRLPGVTMNWNDGEPIFSDQRPSIEQAIDSADPDDAEAARALLGWKDPNAKHQYIVTPDGEMTLDGVRLDATGWPASSAIARRLGEAAAQTLEQSIADLLKKSVPGEFGK